MYRFLAKTILSLGLSISLLGLSGGAAESAPAQRDPFAGESRPFYQVWLDFQQALPDILVWLPVLTGGPHSQVLFGEWHHPTR